MTSPEFINFDIVLLDPINSLKTSKFGMLYLVIHIRSVVVIFNTSLSKTMLWFPGFMVFLFFVVFTAKFGIINLKVLYLFYKIYRGATRRKVWALAQILASSLHGPQRTFRVLILALYQLTVLWRNNVNAYVFLSKIRTVIHVIYNFSKYKFIITYVRGGNVNLL